MTVDEIKTALSKAGLEVEDEARLPNNTGVQLRLKNGSIVNCFDTGTHSVQGRNQEVVNSALSCHPAEGSRCNGAPVRHPWSYLHSV